MSSARCRSLYIRDFPPDTPDTPDTRISKKNQILRVSGVSGIVSGEALDRLRHLFVSSLLRRGAASRGRLTRRQASVDAGLGSLIVRDEERGNLGGVIVDIESCLARRTAGA
jgi:hypothetical protein